MEGMETSSGSCSAGISSALVWVIQGPQPPAEPAWAECSLLCPLVCRGSVCSGGWGLVRNFETQATTFCLFITPRLDDRTSPSLFPQHALPDKTNSFLNQTGRMPASAPHPQPRGLRVSRASRAGESSFSAGSWGLVASWCDISRAWAGSK